MKLRNPEMIKFKPPVLNQYNFPLDILIETPTCRYEKFPICNELALELRPKALYGRKSCSRTCKDRDDVDN